MEIPGKVFAGLGFPEVEAINNGLVKPISLGLNTYHKVKSGK